MKYFVKRTNETEEFSFAATLEEVQAGFKSGEIRPDWGVRAETDGVYDWITVQQLCAPESVAAIPESPIPRFIRGYGLAIVIINTLGLILSFASAVLMFPNCGYISLLVGGIEMAVAFIFIRLGLGLRAGQRAAIYGISIFAAIAFIGTVTMGDLRLVGPSVVIPLRPVAIGLVLLLYGPPIFVAFRNSKRFH